MALMQRIADDLKAALLGGNRFVGETLRGLKAAILDEAIAKNKRDEGLSDEEIEKIIAREVKKRNESANIYTQAGRDDLAESENQEADVLRAYLPTQLSEEEIKAVVNETVTATGAAGMQDMGKVIGSVKQQLGNSADGATVARMVKEALS
ncbi:GatB/YqeY [Candidatus Saccharibacteria bacterium 32-49-10]|nr:MAG: GatB/YqeY [Candidatus Saccharibacteria bacterium 32-49-10]